MIRNERGPFACADASSRPTRVRPARCVASRSFDNYVRGASKRLGQCESASFGQAQSERSKSAEVTGTMLGADVLARTRTA